MAQTSSTAVILRPHVVELGVQDPYLVLGVSKDATNEEVKLQYRRMARATHPDLHPDDPLAEEKFKAIQIALQKIENLRLTSFGFFRDKTAIEIRREFSDGSKLVRIYYSDASWDEGILTLDGTPTDLWSLNSTEASYRKEILQSAQRKYEHAPYKALRNLLGQHNGAPFIGTNRDLDLEFARILHAKDSVENGREFLSELGNTPYDREVVTGLLQPGTTLAQLTAHEKSRSTGVMVSGPNQLDLAVRTEVDPHLYQKSPYRLFAAQATIRYLQQDEKAMLEAMKDPEIFFDALNGYTYPLRQLAPGAIPRLNEILEAAFQSPNWEHQKLAAQVLLTQANTNLLVNAPISLFSAAAHHCGQIKSYSSHSEEGYQIAALWAFVENLQKQKSAKFELYLNVLLKEFPIRDQPYWAKKTITTTPEKPSPFSRVLNLCHKLLQN